MLLNVAGWKMSVLTCVGECWWMLVLVNVDVGECCILTNAVVFECCILMNCGVGKCWCWWIFALMQVDFGDCSTLVSVLFWWMSMLRTVVCGLVANGSVLDPTLRSSSQTNSGHLNWVTYFYCLNRHVLMHLKYIRLHGLVLQLKFFFLCMVSTEKLGNKESEPE